MRDKQIFDDRVQIISDLPIQNLINMKISHSRNCHSRIWIQVIIQQEEPELSLQESYQNQHIEVFDKAEKVNYALFSGKIYKIEFHKMAQYLTADLYGISYSYELDQEKKCNSFQNPDLTFENIVEMLLKNSCARFLWRTNEEIKIGRPFIQYKETDWEFLCRLASHFHTSLQVGNTSNKPEFYFGVDYGRLINIEDQEISEYGFSKKYYEKSGYEKSCDKSEYYYLKIESGRRWNLGDYTYYRGIQYKVYQERIQLEKASLRFHYTLGATGIFHQETLYNDSFIGLRLEGMVKKVEKDYVCVQFDFDQVFKAEYNWPWVPQVSNMGYYMPEVNEKVLLMFPCEDEKEGMVIHSLRDNGNVGLFEYPSGRQSTTIYDKTIGLYPSRVILKGSAGTSAFSLNDDRGILMNSNMQVSLSAQEEIIMVADQVKIQAPQQIVLLTNQSNIELCRDFNFYAPNGVNRKGIDHTLTDNEGDDLIPDGSEQEHWQLSFGAMGAVPGINLSTAKMDDLSSLTTCGAIPKFGKGSSIVSMSQVQEGKKTKKTTFPHAFSSMESYTIKGGKPISKDKKDVGV